MSQLPNLFGGPPKPSDPESGGAGAGQAPPVEAPARVEEPTPAEIEEPAAAPEDEAGPLPAEEPLADADKTPEPPPAEEPAPPPVEESAPPVEASGPAPVEEPEPSPVEEPAPAATAAPTAAGSDAAPSGASDYRVLALQYRPQTFDDLVGQEVIARTLQNAISKDRIWHAFLFAGPRGVGKTTTARILAKALNCAATGEPNPEPCGACPSCQEIAGGFSRDVPEIDGASNNSVEKAREIIETAHYAPVRDRFKIFVVDEVHMLSSGAFNALLKTLEEPPSHVKFIFATTEIHRIPDTILSRCQEFEFRTVTQRVVVDRLRHIAADQKLDIEEEALSQIARSGQGSVRDALSALDQVIGAVDGPVSASDVSEVLAVPDVTMCRRTATAILEADRRAVFEVVEELVAEGRDPRHFVTLLMHYLRDVVVARSAPDKPDLLEWPGEREQLAAFGERFSEEDLLRSLDVLTRSEEGLRWSPDPRFHLEMALLKLVEMPRLAAFESLLERLDEPAPETGGAAAAKAPKPPSEPAPPAKARKRPKEPAAPKAPPAAASGAGAPPDRKKKDEIEVPPPPAAEEYRKTFGGRIVSTRRIPPESAGGDPGPPAEDGPPAGGP